MGSSNKNFLKLVHSSDAVASSNQPSISEFVGFVKELCKQESRLENFTSSFEQYFKTHLPEFKMILNLYDTNTKKIFVASVHGIFCEKGMPAQIHSWEDIALEGEYPSARNGLGFVAAPLSVPDTKVYERLIQIPLQSGRELLGSFIAIAPLGVDVKSIEKSFQEIGDKISSVFLKMDRSLKLVA